VVREGVGSGGRNDPSLVCTYNNKTIKKDMPAIPSPISTYILHSACQFQQKKKWLGF
jgi:hypothetical protein